MNTNDLETFLTAVFSASGTEGNIIVCRSDDATLTSRDIGEIEEFVGNSEVWVSMQTRDAEGKLWEQPAVCAAIDSVEVCPFPPSILLRHGGGDLFAVWFVEPIDLRKFPPCHELTEASPLPGTGGWSIIEVHDDNIYAIEILERALVPLQEPAVVTAGTNQVLVYGDLDPALLAREIEIAISPFGRATQPGRWKRQPFTIEQLIQVLSQHKQGVKDGNSFLQGPAIDGKRQANAIPHMDLLVIDLDTGQSLDEMRAKIQSLGLFAIVYTTHSHLKPVTEIKKDELVKYFDGDANPDIGQVCEYLRTKKRYQAAILEDAELLGTEHTAEGIMVRVKHKPMPKFRIVLVLKDRFVIANQATTQQEAIRIWKERYAGASKMLDAYFDRTCVDPSRLFYTSRHPRDAKEWRVEIIAGKTLDINDCERVTQEEMRKAALDPMERASEDMRGGKGKDYVTDNLLPFFARNGNTFDIADAILDLDPDGSRSERPRGGRIHRCPADDSHSNAGDENDQGFYCVNASDSETGSAVAHCSHDSCSGLDRIDFMDLVCQRAGITDAMELKKWVPETIEEENEPSEVESEEDTQTSDKPEHRAYKNFGEAKRALGNLNKDDELAAGALAVNIGMSGFSSSELEALKKNWIKRSGVSAKVFNDEAKRGKQLAKAQSENGDESLDDDGLAALSAINKVYCALMVNGHFRVIKEPEALGQQPTFILKDDFAAYMANRKVATFSSSGDKKMVPISRKWMEWEDRKTYESLVFKPAPLVVEKHEYNLWKGLAIKPVKGNWSKLQTHIETNICLGIEEYYQFFMTWMSQLLQFPGIKMSSSVVVNGKKGTGKSKVFDWLRAILGEHALKVNDPEQILNGFNAHQMGLILMVAEEAFFAGDQRAAAKLKDSISSDEMLLTRKGIDSVRFGNYARLACCSNENWVVPASLGDERRFFVVQCSEQQRGNSTYFGEIEEQMTHGGAEAMTYDLLNWKPSFFDAGWDILRDPIKTPWLTDQGRESMPIWERFFYQIIDDGKCGKPDKPDDIGEFDFNEDEPNIIVKMHLRWFYEQFIRAGSGGSYKMGDAKLFDSLVEDWLGAEPHLTRTRNPTGEKALAGDRHWCYVCPSLKAIKASLTDRKKLPFSATDEDKPDDKAVAA